MLLQIAGGDESAFRELVNFYGDRFYSLALKMTRSEEVAKDIVQDVFLNIWEKRLSLRDVENPSSYFFTIIYRRIFSHFRKKVTEKDMLRAVSLEKEPENSIEKKLLSKEGCELIEGAIAQLPPRQQEVFRLTKLEGMSREEVARQLQVSPNTVRNHLADAVKFLRIFLKESYILILPFIFS